MTLYRDPLAGLRSQIATKRGLLESRERGLSALVRAMLPIGLRERLGHLREAAVVEAESLEALTQADSALDEILAVHEEVAQLLPSIRECPDDCPDPPKPRVAPPWVFEERPQLAFRSVLTRRLGEIAADAWLVRWDDTTYLSRVRLPGGGAGLAPVVLTCTFDATTAQVTTFKSTVRTSVPRSVPALAVRPSRIFDGIGRALGIVRDTPVGSEVFDEAFIVDCASRSPTGDAEGAAAGLLGSDVVRALLSMASLGPRLDVRHGLAKITWSLAYGARGEELMPDAAFDAILGLRAAVERA